MLDAAARRSGFGLKFDEYDWSCDTYNRTGAMMPGDGLAQSLSAPAEALACLGW